MSFAFSPLVVTKLIVLPLRYFFSTYTGGYDLHWDKDEKKSTIEIGGINDFHKVPLQLLPRILVDRGDYQIIKTGLTDNMAQRFIPAGTTVNNNDDRINMVFIQGQAQIIIEARNKGTCELVTDMVSHFIVWSRPFLCDTQGFKEFGLPMTVTTCSPDKEDTDKFKVIISFPYMMEEEWTVRQEALGLKGFFLSMTAT